MKSVGQTFPTWRQLHSDTSREAKAILFAYWREVPAWEKWQRWRVCAAVIQMPESERQWRLADLTLGPELAARVYGPLPA